MLPIKGKRLYVSLAAAGLLTLGAAGVTTAAYAPHGHGASVATSADADAQSGAIDDGKELLPQATLTVEQAISAAQAVATGAVGEIDIEHADGRLVFNVEIGNQDVKIDAADG